MEFIIGIAVVYLIYRIFSGKAQDKAHDAVIGAAVRLGVPAREAIMIYATQIDELSKLLAFTAQPQSKVAHLSVHERMAYCINVVYRKQK